MFLGTFIIKIGKSGRIVIPKKLSKELDGASSLVLLGCGDHIEIWSPAAWESEKVKIKKVLDKIL